MEYIILAINILICSAVFTLFVKQKCKTLILTIMTFLAALTACIPAVKLLLTGGILRSEVPSSLIFGAIPIELNVLSSIFVIIISCMSFLVSLYANGYLKKYIDAGKSITTHCFFLQILIAAMLMVVCVKHGLFFLFAWEIMSLSSFFLVIFEGEKKDVIKAGLKYLIYMHFSIIFLIAMFSILTNATNTFLFSDYAKALIEDAKLANLVFILGTIGFGIKAGFVPFHNWLPSAHPAAPSHISALMSGVMIKTGIYGILMLINLIGNPTAGQAYFILIIGLISALYGILYAITQQDIKKILACSSIENMGIIALGIAVGMFGLNLENNLIAILGFSGAILHVLNHSIFKILSFMCAGSIYTQTHTRNIEKLGGLIKKMPYTSLAFIIGSLAITGLPLFNGFISEILIYGGMIYTIPNDNIAMFLVIISSIACLAFVGSIALLCFTRLIGISLLGSGRTDATLAVQNDVSPVMTLPQLILATSTIIIGIFPYTVLPTILTAVSFFFKDQTILNSMNDIVLLSKGISKIFLIFVGILLVILALKVVLRRASKNHSTWGCGYNKPTSAIQYTASSYANPFISMIKPLFKRVSHIKKPKDLFPKDAYYEQEIEDIEEAYIVNPLVKLDEKLLSKFERIQNGNIQQYILFGLIFLIIAIFGVIFIG